MITREDCSREDNPNGEDYTLIPALGSRPLVDWIEINVRGGRRSRYVEAVCYFTATDGGGHEPDSMLFDTEEEAEAWAIERVNSRPYFLAFRALEEAFAEIATVIEYAAPAFDRIAAEERAACAAIADDHARERRERMQKSTASWLEERAIAAEDIASEIRARSKGGAR